MTVTAPPEEGQDAIREGSADKCCLEILHTPFVRPLSTYASPVRDKKQLPECVCDSDSSDETL